MNENMDGIIMLIILTSLIMWVLYWYKLRFEPGSQLGSERETFKQKRSIIYLLLVAFIVKSIIATFEKGHGVDVNCFTVWSDQIFENGIKKFYSSGGFSDYPPGYMYILYVTSGIRRLLGIDEANSISGVYLIKLVPILCDLGAGYLIYEMARKRFSKNASLFLCLIYVLNPAIVINSSVWCQVDSVFALAVLLMCYFCMQRKRIFAYFVFAFGILLKPQTIIFTPILIFTIIDQLFLEKGKFKLASPIHWNQILIEAGMGILAILSICAASIPFGLVAVFNQYKNTLASYDYATVNAYNFWGFLGRNWAKQNGKFLFIEYRNWGTFAIVMAVLLGAWVYFKNREDDSKYFISSAVIISTMFAFSVRMHERYNYPVIALLLIAYILKPKKEYFISFIVMTVIHFLNVAHVLYTYLVYESTGPEDVNLFGLGNVDLIRPLAIILLFMFGYILHYSLSKKELKFTPMVRTRKGFQKPELEKKKHIFTITPSKLVDKMKRIDYIILFAILLVYSMFAFYRLGSFSAPETNYSIDQSWDENVPREEILLDLGKETEIDNVWVYLGNEHNRNFKLEMGNDLNQPFENLKYARFCSVFSWQEIRIAEDTDDETETIEFVADKPYRYIKFIAEPGKSIFREMVILDKSKNKILPVNKTDYQALFDEQQLFDTTESFMYGTYFDEIYHARTAYEMIEGVYCYENTHPPFGKFLISLGIRTFGMNPFGWRIVGTLFGIFMLPFIYLFGKRMFSKTWTATIVTILFAFDFMHFVQTRIATIDVYGTFFIIAMYYFMYCYTRKSFYDTKLWKTLVYLGLSGICMGFGIASKWTAAYAGAGLAIILAAVLFIRYREYRLACKNSKGSTAGISHETIVNGFKKNILITLGFCLVFFVLIPGLIYLMSYIPFNNGTDEGLWARMISNQKGMFDYHSKLVATHPYSSWWYEWPTMVRPVFYYSTTLANGLKEGISAFGNPLVWWTGIPCLGYMGYLIWKERDKTALFIVVSYFAQYVPWMLVSRITFAYHYFPSVPFVVLMIGYTMIRFVGDNRKRMIYIIGYTACAVALFILFYPVLSGLPVSKEFITNGLRWMNDWVLA